jgi:pimeloyl-ACP methyl ester carboxylesterase
MFSSHFLLCCLIANPPQVETRFEQVQPVLKPATALERSPGQTRAIVLIHGLRVYPLHRSKVVKPRFHSWQEPGSSMVKALGKQGDVFAFAYGQNASMEEIAVVPALADALGRLRKLGYQDIVVVGHSAGGVIARLFVEDHPDAGVTKVIQVCAPNGGTSWARADIVRDEQERFLQSLTKAERTLSARKRAHKVIPQRVQFLCVVGSTTGTLGDGLLSRLSQWPDDLQRQGIPALLLPTTHFTVMRSSKVAERLAELVRLPHARWTDEERHRMRKQVFNGSAN